MSYKLMTIIYKLRFWGLLFRPEKEEIIDEQRKLRMEGTYNNNNNNNNNNNVYILTVNMLRKMKETETVETNEKRKNVDTGFVKTREGKGQLQKRRRGWKDSNKMDRSAQIHCACISGFGYIPMADS